MDIDNGYFISEHHKPCCVCGKLTNRIEYNYEAYICSQECEDAINKELAEYELRGGSDENI